MNPSTVVLIIIAWLPFVLLLVGAIGVAIYCAFDR